jgi:hypothetical protein
MVWFGRFLASLVDRDWFIDTSSHILTSSTFWAALSPLVALLITVWTIRHEQRIREDSSRPWIDVGVRVDDNADGHDLVFQIQNVGGSVAVGILAHTDPVMLNTAMQPLIVAKSPIPTLAPLEYRDFLLGKLDRFTDYHWVKGVRSKSHLVTVTYWNVPRTKNYRHRFEIDLSPFGNIENGTAVEAVVIDLRGRPPTATWQGRRAPGWQRHVWKQELADLGLEIARDDEGEITAHRLGYGLIHDPFRLVTGQRRLYRRRQEAVQGPPYIEVLFDDFPNAEHDVPLALITAGARCDVLVPLDPDEN